MARRRGKGGAHHEEHADESWLIPYADILTLLLALFIVLFAVGQTEQQKVEEMAASFASAFSAGGMLASVEKSVAIQQMKTPANKLTVIMSKASGQTADDRAYMKETVELIQAQKMIEEYAKENDLLGVLETSYTDEGLMIRIRDGILFPSGQAMLLPGAQKVAGQVASVLAKIPQKVIVSGHTDNMPINTAVFPSNWELSTSRAVNFMRMLMAQDKSLKAERFTAEGHAEFRPIMPNNNEENRSKNRRVEVMISRTTK